MTNPMTTDHDPAAKAATEILGFVNRSPRPTESPQTWDSIASEVAAIIRRYYEPRERLLERAVKLLTGGMQCLCAMDKPKCERCNVLAEAASMGIGKGQSNG